MTRRGRSVVAGFIGLLIALAHAGEACAHASLVRASPADGAVRACCAAGAELDVQRAGLAAGDPSHRTRWSVDRAALGRWRKQHCHGHRARELAARNAPAELARDLGRRASGRRLVDVLDRRAERAARGGRGQSRRARRAHGPVGGQGRALCRALRRHRRRLLLCLVCRARFRGGGRSRGCSCSSPPG